MALGQILSSSLVCVSGQYYNTPIFFIVAVLQMHLMGRLDPFTSFALADPAQLFCANITMQ